MLVSHLWGIPGTEAEREAARAGVYVAGLSAFLVVVERKTAKAFLVGVLTGIVGLECLALGQKAVGGGAPDPTQGSLLVGSIGYANALGILASVAVLLALALSWDERRSAPRGLFVVSGLISAVALTLTSSRGALISLGVGLLVLVALRLRRETERRGWWLAPIAATVAAGVVLVVAQPSLGDRPAYWHVAASDVARRPVLGSGAGTFDDVWYANRPITASVRDAHSLYLEVLAELGPSDSSCCSASSCRPCSPLRAQPMRASSRLPPLAMRRSSFTQDSTGTGRCRRRRLRGLPAEPPCSSRYAP
jgi:O-antigen ligase